MLHAVPDLLRTAISFIAVLGVLVFVHEFGHYLAARLVGVHVEAFSIGFGQALTRWTDRHGTVWKLAWIPLGGYVKLHGQEPPEDVPEERRKLRKTGRTFYEKSVGARAVVVAAGPAANFALAVILFFALFAALGRPLTLPVVTEVMPGSAAAAAGLSAGDRITAIDGKAVPTFDVLQEMVGSHPGAKVTIAYSHAGTPHTADMTIGSQTVDGRTIGLLGIKGGIVEYNRESVGAAAWGGVTETWRVTVETVKGLGQIVLSHQGMGELGGPLRIAQLSGEVAALGVASLLSFIAVLSVNLGLINLFPIPVLDGGHLVFYLFEALRGRPLPPRAQEYGFRAGIALLFGLMVFATWNDLGHLGLFRWLAG